MADRRTSLALATLAAACFVSMTAENAPIALLPDLTRALGASSAQIGFLVTEYAVIVAVTAVPLIRLTARFDRRTLAVVTIGAVAVSNLLAVVDADYAWLSGVRVIAALGHGVFWSIVPPVAARLVSPGNEGRATGTVFAGNALAVLGGIPLTSALGGAIGWRPTVLVLALAAAVIAGLLVRTLPALPPQRDTEFAQDVEPGAGARRTAGPATVLSVLRQRALVAVVLATLVVVFGHFIAYTYVTVLIQHFAGLHGGAVTVVLLAQGGAGVVALVAVRRLLDGRPRAVAVAVPALMAAGLALLALSAVGGGAPLAVIALIVWPLGSVGIAVVLQAGVLRAVRPSMQDTGSGAYVVAFQIGIAGGAAVGGRFVDADAYVPLALVAAALIVIGTVVVARARAFAGHERRTRALV